MAPYSHIRVFYGSNGLVHFISFTDGWHNGQYVKRYELWGRHFALTDTPTQDFCDTPSKHRQTCKQTGAKLFFDKGLTRMPFYRSILLRTTGFIPAGTEQANILMRTVAGILPTEQFNACSAAVSQARRDYCGGQTLLRGNTCKDKSG